MMNNENYEHVKAIAKELEELVNNEYVSFNGDFYKVEEDENGDRYANVDGVIYKEGDEENDLNDLDYFGIWDYFEDCYDIEYTCDAQKEYKAVRIMIACGGPNIYVNTRSGDVELYWWTETARYPLAREVIEEIDGFFEEEFNCI